MKSIFNTPFNLDAAKSGAPVVRSDGIAVERFLCWDAKGQFPILYQVVGRDAIYYCDRTGKANLDDTEDARQSLFMGVPKQKGYINLYEAAVHEERVFFYDTMEDAFQHRGSDCLATIPIEW